MRLLEAFDREPLLLLPIRLAMRRGAKLAMRNLAVSGSLPSQYKHRMSSDHDILLNSTAEDGGNTTQ